MQPGRINTWSGYRSGNAAGHSLAALLLDAGRRVVKQRAVAAAALQRRRERVREGGVDEAGIDGGVHLRVGVTRPDRDGAAGQ